LREATAFFIEFIKILLWLRSPEVFLNLSFPILLVIEFADYVLFGLQAIRDKCLMALIRIQLLPPRPTSFELVLPTSDRQSAREYS